MKKILMLALCAATVSGAFAQKQAVADAKKLSGKIDKIEEARELIQGAMKNVETSNAAETYYVAGNIEWDAYDKARALQMINPEDPAVDPAAMATQLLNGYNYFLQALPLDSLPNEKGQVKPKYSKNIHSKIAAHSQEFFTAGANAFNNKKYYPEAYEAFMIYANTPGEGIDRATAYFNAGLGAYSGNQVEKAAEAFRQARLNGYDSDEAYIYELACWQSMAKNDPSLEATAQEHIYEIAQAGNEKFGVEKPIFLSNLVNCLVSQNKIDDAIALVGENIAANPDAANLYSLRAFVENRKGDVEAAEADYRKVASMENADFESLKNTCIFMLKRGQELWSEVQGTTAEDNAKRQNAYENYWQWANSVGDKAASINPNDPELNNVLDNLEYLLELNKGKF